MVHMSTANAVVDTAMAVNTKASTQKTIRISLGCHMMNKHVRSIAPANDIPCNMNNRPRMLLYHGENEYVMGTEVVQIAATNVTTRIHRRRVSISRVIGAFPYDAQ